MNYASFIVKILEKPILTFFDNTNPVTQFTVQIPQLKKNNESTAMCVNIWGKLGYDITQYYQINDYIIIEGYLSIRNTSLNQFTIKSFKKVELSIYKIYPFVL
jgi:single-stranded DNA-binding protein